MAKYLQCSECGKLAFYYDDYVGTEKPFYLKYMRYPNDAKPEAPRCFSCGAAPRRRRTEVGRRSASISAAAPAIRPRFLTTTGAWSALIFRRTRWRSVRIVS